MQSEKQKMISGQAYRAFDQELVKERQHAQELLFRHNQVPPSRIRERKSLLKQLLGTTDSHFYIEQPFRCDYGYNIHIGTHFYANYNCIILDCAPVHIGDHVMFAPNVSIYTAGHPIHHIPRSTGIEYALPVHIGDHVWIGGNTVINPGVRIGNNSVIGSGSVVTKDIPADVVAVGNPCRVMRKISEEEKGFVYKDFRIPRG